MMSKPNINPTPWSLVSPTDPKASQTDANLRLATENAQPIHLRRTLQELRQTLPDPHKVTAALLLATQQKYIEKIKASKGAQGEEEEEEDEDEDEEGDSESDGASDIGEISELSSEEVEDEGDSDDGSDERERSELGSEEEDDGTDEEGASTTASLRHTNVKSGLRKTE